jgi:hypothetical protein
MFNELEEPTTRVHQISNGFYVVTKNSAIQPKLIDYGKSQNQQLSPLTRMHIGAKHVFAKCGTNQICIIFR